METDTYIYCLPGGTLNQASTYDCFGDRHVWDAHVGDPVPETFWIGKACMCGAKRIASHTCECGNTHQQIVDRG